MIFYYEVPFSAVIKNAVFKNHFFGWEMTANYEPLENFDAVNWETQVVFVAGKEPKAAYAFPRDYLFECSASVKSQLEAQTEDEIKEGLLLPGVCGDTLAEVVKFVKYHETHPMRFLWTPLQRPWVELVGAWDRSYIQGLMGPTPADYDRLVAVADAAINLELENLRDLTTSYFSTLLLDKPVSELRQLLKLTEADRYAPELEREMVDDFKTQFKGKAGLFDV